MKRLLTSEPILLAVFSVCICLSAIAFIIHKWEELSYIQWLMAIGGGFILIVTVVNVRRLIRSYRDEIS